MFHKIFIINFPSLTNIFIIPVYYYISIIILIILLRILFLMESKKQLLSKGKIVLIVINDVTVLKFSLSSTINHTKYIFLTRIHLLKINVKSTYVFRDKSKSSNIIIAEFPLIMQCVDQPLLFLAYQ